METGHSHLLERSAIEGTYSPESVSWVQLGAGAFSVRFGSLYAGPLELTRRDYSVGFSVSAAVVPGKLVTGLLADSQTRCRVFGLEADDASILATRDSLELVADGAGANYTISIDEKALQEQFPNAPDALDVLDVQKVELLQDPVSAARLRRFLDKVFVLHGPPGTSVYGTLIPLLAGAMKRVDLDRLEPSPCYARRVRAVHECEAYLHAHLDRSVSLLELSQVSGMKSRSLINAFEAVTGLSPMDYLRRLRLSNVHRELKVAEKSQTRVSDVATQWGFWHFSHFTAEYYKMFGEMPSQTLSTANTKS